jgi:hypothetical protein
MVDVINIRAKFMNIFTMNAHEAFTMPKGADAAEKDGRVRIPPTKTAGASRRNPRDAADAPLPEAMAGRGIRVFTYPDLYIYSQHSPFRNLIKET